MKTVLVSANYFDVLGSHPALGRFFHRDEGALEKAAVADGRPFDGVVETAVRHGPTVRLRVRMADGAIMEAAVASLDHPAPGDRVTVAVDPEGVVRLT